MAPDLAALARELTVSKEDGRIKLYVTARALRSRRDHPRLFATGTYLPVATSGPHEETIFAFVRQQDGVSAMVVAPRMLTRLVGSEQAPCGAEVWGETLLHLPEAAASPRWLNVFTGENLVVRWTRGQRVLPAAEVFANFPVGLLMGQG